MLIHVHVHANTYIHYTCTCITLIQTFDGRRFGAGVLDGVTTRTQPGLLAGQTHVEVDTHLAVNAPAKYVRLAHAAFVSEVMTS